MGNKTMQAKMAKHRRNIRKLPRQMPSGSTPNKGVLKEYKDRAKGLEINEAEVDDLIRRFYGRDPWTGTSPERLAVYELLCEIKEMVPEMLFFEIIPQNSAQRLRCYFNSRKTCFVLAWDLYRKGMSVRSCEYPSRDAAITAWNRSKVTWVQRKKFNPNS